MEHAQHSLGQGKACWSIIGSNLVKGFRGTLQDQELSNDFWGNLCMMCACWEMSAKMGKVSFIVLSLSSTGRSRYLARIACDLSSEDCLVLVYYSLLPSKTLRWSSKDLSSLNHMSMYTGIYRSIYPSSYPSIHPAIRPSINCSSHLAALSIDLSSGSILQLHRNSRPTTIQLQRGPVVSRTELLYVAVWILSNLQAPAHETLG